MATISKVVSAVGQTDSSGKAAVSLRPWREYDVMSSAATVIVMCIVCGVAATLLTPVGSPP